MVFILGCTLLPTPVSPEGEGAVRWYSYLAVHFYLPLSALRERGLYVGIHTWLYTFTYPCQPIEGEGTVIPLINLSPENEKTLGHNRSRTRRAASVCV